MKTVKYGPLENYRLYSTYKWAKVRLNSDMYSITMIHCMSATKPYYSNAIEGGTLQSKYLVTCQRL